jgi:hypothetical protein
MADELKDCEVCKGKGEYRQTYTAGCGFGSYRSMGKCGYCNGTGQRAAPPSPSTAPTDELHAEVERLRAAVETRDALLRALNAVAIERGDKFGACDCIDNKGNPYPSQHLADVLAAGAPTSGNRAKP